MTRSSVTTAETSSAGVMSNAKFSARVPAGAACPVTSSSARSSIGIAAPDGVEESSVDSGAATRNGMPAARAARARL
jgi:hypothetical protein